jgi:hypothetical protein
MAIFHLMYQEWQMNSLYALPDLKKKHAWFVHRVRPVKMVLFGLALDPQFG